MPVFSAVGEILGMGARDKGYKKGQDTIWKMYEQTREDLAPWRESGTRAVQELEKRVFAGPGNYTKSPGYDFRFKEGQRALNANYAAEGAMGGGAHQKALMQYGQDIATNDYQNFLNRYYNSLSPLQSLSGLGQATAVQGGQMGMNAAQQVANLQVAQGASRASSFGNLMGLAGEGLGSLYGLMNKPATTLSDVSNAAERQNSYQMGY